MIYYIGNEQAKVVKIGFTKYDNAQERLSSLQTGNHLNLKILATRKGSSTEEKFLHQYLKEFHIKGEWFKLTPNVMSTVDLEITEEMYSEHIKVSCKLTNSEKVKKNIFKLSTCSRSLLLWILFNMNKNNRIILLNKDKYMLYSNVSLNTYKKSLKELIDTNLITLKESKNKYEVSHTLFT